MNDWGLEWQTGRLNALLEEERARAASLPVQPGMRRLEISDGGRSQPSQPQGGGGQLVGRPLMEKFEMLLSDPRAEALGLGALTRCGSAFFWTVAASTWTSSSKTRSSWSLYLGG